MKRIGLISDNHGYFGPEVMKYLDEVDEVWHAGDIGSLESIQPIISKKPFRAVYGNIDSGIIRTDYPLNLDFECEEVKVFMTHIGGYPGRYYNRVKNILVETKPQLYICGHSHICKVMYDKKLSLLHMNPGAYGFHGWHKVRTILRFTCDAGQIKDAEVIELGSRSSKST
jgi:putative phosphoesterase